MENLTQKERIDLESVFATICTKKESKILVTYKDLCSAAASKFHVVKNKIKKIKFYFLNNMKTKNKFLLTNEKVRV